MNPPRTMCDRCGCALGFVDHPFGFDFAFALAITVVPLPAPLPLSLSRSHTGTDFTAATMDAAAYVVATVVRGGISRCAHGRDRDMPASAVVSVVLVALSSRFLANNCVWSASIPDPWHAALGACRFACPLFCRTYF